MFGERKVALCVLDDDNNVLAMTHEFTLCNSVELESARRDFGSVIDNEISTIIAEDLRKQITRDTVSDILKAVKEN